ncbi:Protein ImuB [Dyadobacter sp. CECT 9275]|uniref:Protein ImuB n=1 Tax=Dyadobacter helix TaxID=2822344 RepID=A0A916ND96_9BACT|nr:DNA polymerase Y family protein [Dyadobacter sp. CECT 9275]CAG5006798.1 Protein ImuB [Dyadobacter sp. CECT 9275]
MKRYVAVWFRQLLTDRVLLRQPELEGKPFVLAAKACGRMVVMAASRDAQKIGIDTGMVLADARALMPELEVLDFDPMMGEKLLTALAEWAIRYSPIVAVDLPDGLMLDVTGCAHLWGSETAYLKDIASRLKASGYHVHTAMADTIGAAWAISRYSRDFPIVAPGEQMTALLTLPPHALRLEDPIIEKMHKLGLYQIKSFIYMPASVLRRRFGQNTLDQIGKALGSTYEPLLPVQPVEPYQERLASMEPILTATGIEIALQKLLEKLCARLRKDGKGLRQAVLKCYRIDGETRQIAVGTNGPSCSAVHLFGLFELKIASIEPALGIELFVLEAPVTEELPDQQETIWNLGEGNKMAAIAELLDRIAARAGADVIHRYLPAEHYWPERAMIEATNLNDKPETQWRSDQYRPIQLLPEPERIQVSAPIPDYPPMLFRYKGQVHRIQKADGPDRIEQEWWLSDGLHRDYYSVEDEQGGRYWIFRLGHYGDEHLPQWFIHGFFA